MPNDMNTIISEDRIEQYEMSYAEALASSSGRCNDAVFRAEWELAWLREAGLQGIEEQWSYEDCFSWVASQMEAGGTVFLCMAKRCAAENREEIRTLLRCYLKEELLFWDWDAPCDRRRIREMDGFAEAAQLMECLFPEDFLEFCLKWISKISLEGEYIPELLMKGIIHTGETQLETLLQSPSLSMGIKIGLLNYLCESDIRRDSIYLILKNLFKQNKDRDEKHFLGILLGEYKDGRAIPVLRKYLENLVQEQPINPEMCREIASAIYKIGGQCEDIMHI